MDEEETAVNVVQGKPGGELIKQVTICAERAIECNALIDSGSGKSLVRRSSATACECKIVPCKENLLGFAGGKIRCLEKIVVNIKIDDNVRSVELIIVEDNVMSYDMLIGFDILSRGTVLIENGVCRVMSIKNDPVEVETEAEEADKMQLRKLSTSYGCCSGENLHELGKSEPFKMKIVLNSTKPVYKKPYHIPTPERDISGNKLLAAMHDDVNTLMNVRREEAIKSIDAAREKWKARVDAKHAKPIKYHEGDLILIASPRPATGESRKLQPNYKGPYVVKRVLRYDRYVVEDVEGVRRSTKKYSSVAAADKMKPFCSLFPEADGDPDDDDEEDVMT